MSVMVLIAMVIMDLEVLFILLVRIVPDGFDENLQYRVQVRNEYQESYEEDGEYCDSDYLEPCDRDIREERRYDEREYDEDDGRDKCPDIDQEEREIEMEGDAQITECHAD